jgi:hypothetical protein
MSLHALVLFILLLRRGCHNVTSMDQPGHAFLRYLVLCQYDKMYWRDFYGSTCLCFFAVPEHLRQWRGVLRQWTRAPATVDPSTYDSGPEHLRQWTRAPATVEGFCDSGPEHLRQWTRAPTTVDPSTCDSGPEHLRQWTRAPTTVDPSTYDSEPEHLRQ